MRFLAYLALFFLTFAGGFASGYWFPNLKNTDDRKALENILVREKGINFEKYSIDSLSNTQISTGKFEILEKTGEDEEHESFLFAFEFHPDPESQQTKTTTGRINLPKKEIIQRFDGKMPVIVMVRGFVSQEIYQTGMGTRNAASYFAKNGFITIAPDFLGYAGSSRESENIFETRFQTYVTVLSLLKTIEAIPDNTELTAISESIENRNQITNLLNNHITIFLWGHSNGGQIVLTSLAITGETYPTTLWAPVGAPFPYSVLYYTYDSQDGGRLIRSELAKIENRFDLEKFSFWNYLEKIKAPILIHQGTNDDAVPYKWNDKLVRNLQRSNVEVEYIKYPADHNLRPYWNTVVERDLQFYLSNLH